MPQSDHQPKTLAQVTTESHTSVQTDVHPRSQATEHATKRPAPLSQSAATELPNFQITGAATRRITESAARSTPTSGRRLRRLIELHAAQQTSESNSSRVSLQATSQVPGAGKR
jgi:hypothetical protein